MNTYDRLKARGAALLLPIAFKVVRQLLRWAGLSESSARGMAKMFAQCSISAATISRLKKETGRRVLICFGGADLENDSSRYTAVRELFRRAGPGYIIGSGGGPGWMRAALEGGQLGGAITFGLKLVVPKTLRFQHAKSFQHVTLVHEDFYSRVFNLIEHADAILVGDGRLGTLQEATWVMGCIQLGTHRRIPVFVLTEGWGSLLKLLDEMVLAGKITQEEREIIIPINTGDELTVYDRINQWCDQPDRFANHHLMSSGGRTGKLG
jgi:predicted Rossmann-fold nucleotide-binding protein